MNYEAIARTAGYSVFEGDNHPGVWFWAKTPGCVSESEFDSAEGAWRGCVEENALATGVFKFMVPVFVTVEDGRVTEVHVADETNFDVGDCELIEGCDDDLEALVKAALDGQDWPSWEFGW